MYFGFEEKRTDVENILFIDASQHYEKIKTQNVLRNEDIDKIINTYKNRITEEKYSHLVQTQFIASQVYNLNIPRYVDTFEEEDTIDLKAITTELRELAVLGKITDKTISDFCNELGIETPF